MQNSNTRDMIFNVATLISFLSQGTTLYPGTIIITGIFIAFNYLFLSHTLIGTPEGVGFTRTPPVYLKKGDEVVIEIEGIGKLRNPVIEE